MLMKDHVLCFSAVALILATFGASAANAAKCNTSSGSTCTVSCSTGTATAVCSNNSKNCSLSCSDSEGNMELNLVRSLQIITDGQLDEYDARDLLYQYFDSVLQYFQGDSVDTIYGTITIDVD